MVKLNPKTIAMSYELQQLRHEYNQLIGLEENKDLYETGQYAIIETVPKTNGQINFILRGSQTTLRTFGHYLGFDTDQRSFRQTLAHKFRDYTLTKSPEQVKRHLLENLEKGYGLEKSEIFMFENTMPIKTTTQFEDGYHILHLCGAFKDYDFQFSLLKQKLLQNMKQSTLQSEIEKLKNSIMRASGQARQNPMRLIPTPRSRSIKRKAPVCVRSTKRRRYEN